MHHSILMYDEFSLSDPFTKTEGWWEAPRKMHTCFNPLLKQKTGANSRDGLWNMATLGASVFT